MEHAKKFVSVAIIYDSSDRSLLLQHRDADARISPGKWGLFGGHNEGDEVPVQTLIRELEEEIGIRFQEQEIKPFHDYAVTAELHRYVFLIERALERSAIKLGEGQGFEWVPLQKVFDYDLTDRTLRDMKVFVPPRLTDKEN